VDFKKKGRQLFNSSSVRRGRKRSLPTTIEEGKLLKEKKELFFSEWKRGKK